MPSAAAADLGDERGERESVEYVLVLWKNTLVRSPLFLSALFSLIKDT